MSKHSERVEFRAKSENLAKCREAAKLADMTLSEWIRHCKQETCLTWAHSSGSTVTMRPRVFSEWKAAITSRDCTPDDDFQRRMDFLRQQQERAEEERQWRKVWGLS